MNLTKEGVGVPTKIGTFTINGGEMTGLLKRKLYLMVQASFPKLKDILFRFSGFTEKLKQGFTFVYMFYTFIFLPQLKIGKCLSL